MKKKGFTLVELLAVIAILAILVIIALPNVMSLFNEAKKNSFANELKEIYKTAQNQWMTDSMINTSDQYYSRVASGTTLKCDGTNDDKTLQLSGRTQLHYGIKVNKAGKVVSYAATDGTFTYEFNNSAGLKIEDIDTSTGNLVQLVSDSAGKTGATIKVESNNYYIKLLPE